MSSCLMRLREVLRIAVCCYPNNIENPGYLTALELHFIGIMDKTEFPNSTTGHSKLRWSVEDIKIKIKALINRKSIILDSVPGLVTSGNMMPLPSEIIDELRTVQEECREIKGRLTKLQWACLYHISDIDQFNSSTENLNVAIPPAERENALAEMLQEAHETFVMIKEQSEILNLSLKETYKILPDMYI